MTGKSIVKLYFWIVVILSCIGFLFGFAFPFLISAPNTELVLFGMFAIAVFPVVIGGIIMKKIIPIFKTLKEKN